MDLDKTILDICNDIKNDKKTAKNNVFGQDQDKKPNKNNDLVQPGFEKTEKRGRKNKGLTKLHYEQYKKEYAETKKTFRHIKQPNEFNNNIVEHVNAEIVNIDDLNQFKDLYSCTCDSILEQFKQDNADLVKKHPYSWFKPLLIKIKMSVPAVSADDIDKLSIIWDILALLLYNIGLYPTFEIFQFMTNIYKYQLEDRQKLNPKYSDLLKKINNDSVNALITEIATNPYNQTNKIFLAKVNGIIEKTEPKTIEVNHNIKNYDNISNYRLSDNGKN